MTRPGLSYIAGALAVELMVSLTQHPLGGLAPASVAVPHSQHIDHDLGLIPHQVRGFLTHFANLLIVGSQYDKCTACSDKVSFRSPPFLPLSLLSFHQKPKCIPLRPAARS